MGWLTNDRGFKWWCGLIMSLPFSFAETPLQAWQDKQPELVFADQAISDGLYEIAIERFGQLLKKTRNPQAVALVTFKQVEAYIRSGKPEEAVKVLQHSGLAQLPEAQFWKAQALAALGKLAESVHLFEEVRTQLPFSLQLVSIRSEINLLQLLHKRKEALVLVDLLIDSPLIARKDRQKALLKKAILLTEEKDWIAVDQVLEQVSTKGKEEAREVDYVRGKVYLAKGKTELAIKTFNDLKSQGKIKSSEWSLIFLGLADGFWKQGKTTEAIEILIKNIDENPKVSTLQETFSRLDQWVGKESLWQKKLLRKLDEWAEIVPSLNQENRDMKWQYPNRRALALFYGAIFLRRFQEDQKVAIQRLTQLRVDYPEHVLI